MPEIKHNFTGGRMNKDLDERLVPNGEYRDAMNIQVSTSEGSDVGTVQNILGNKIMPIENGFVFPGDATVIGSIADEKIDTLYWLVWTSSADYIFSYKRGDVATKIIFRDVDKNALMFDPQNIITGINIIDDMLFWTDNKTEPKKINIPRSIIGTPLNPSLGDEQTKLVNSSLGTIDVRIEEKHITVIKKTPPTPLDMKFKTSRDVSKIYTGVITTGIDSGGSNNTSFVGGIGDRYNFQGLSAKVGSNIFTITIKEGINSSGEVIPIGPIGSPTTSGLPGLTGWHTPNYSGPNQGRIPAGTKIVFKPFDDDKSAANPHGTPPGLPVTAHVIKGVVEDALPNDTSRSTYSDGIQVRVTSVDGYPPIASTPIFGGGITDPYELKYVVDLFEEEEKLFEFKFPRFSYRYKYEDGEYSPFAPFTQVAFSPGSFDYHPRKGYNLGMVNQLNEVRLGRFINSRTPKDVVSVDILFKDEPSPNVYIVDTISPDDDITSGGTNAWNTVMFGGYYSIDKETISSVTPSNQMLRPWDNVPKKALAQDVTGNRIVYANYVQNYNLTTINNKKYFAEFNVNWDTYPNQLTEANRSIKSLREYQLGVVFIDKYGRETPVISNPTGTKRLAKSYADKNNRIKVEMLGQEFPQELTHFKFFVKETADQYYNMAMDRWYNAEDGNIWLAFPSSDRNKIDIDTFLILKKGTDADVLVQSAARYKVIAIENEAPDFIKTSKNKIITTKHVSDSDNTNLFGTGSLDIPSVNNDEFKMRYEPFLGSTGRTLDSIKEDLYVEFAKAGKNEVSKRYKISSITNDWNGTIDNVTNAQYSVKLEKKLGDDVNFISDSPTGAAINKIDDGALVNIYKYKVEDKPQFDGRFFVKIYYDEVFKNNITASVVSIQEDLIVTDRKMVYGLNELHIPRHTYDVGRCHINGATTYNGSNDWDNNVGFVPNTTLSSAVAATNGGHDGFLWNREMAHGYYLDDNFSSFALYFRRYRKNPETQIFANNNEWGFANTDNAPFDSNQSYWSYHPLHYLEVGGTHESYLPHAEGSNAGTSVSSKWAVAPASYDELSKPAPEFQSGMTANFGDLNINPALLAPDGSFHASGYVEAGAHINAHTTFNPIIQATNPRQTEVWFIDNGPKAGKTQGGDDDITWGSRGELHGHTTVQGSNIDASSTLGDGINTTYSADYTMEIGFGGISRIYGVSGTTSNFFNVGDWATPSDGAANVNYNDLDSFVENFSIGSQFRWREDPSQTVYTIGGASIEQKLRHSYRRNRSNHIIYGDGGAEHVVESDRFSIVSSNGRLYSADHANVLHGFGVDGAPSNKAESLPFNFTKNWKLGDITPHIIDKWNPDMGKYGGIINNGLSIELTSCNSTGGNSGGSTCTGSDVSEDLKIFVTSLVGPHNGGPDKMIHVGMALDNWVAGGVPFVSYLNFNSPVFVIRHIINKGDYFELWLGGYNAPLTNADHNHLVSVATPDFNTAAFRFVQVAVNGYSPNSEFNINTMGKVRFGTNGQIGAITAVGYTLEFLGVVEPEEVLSENPAIFETEPKDVKDLDIYYEATASMPINIDASNIQDAIPFGSILTSNSINVILTGYKDADIVTNIPFVSGTQYNFPISLRVERPDGLDFNVSVINIYGDGLFRSGSQTAVLVIDPFLYGSTYSLPWFNCYSFGNGVESNRIRDNFNLAFIANGVKASTTLEQEYKEEHRKYGLIYSGLYNSTSGVNNLNQFIAAEKITKDVNPIYGSIQKLHSRDSDLVTLCEDKCLRILANKDAVFNADGNTNLTATANVLGQTIPFSGEYGISTNPESFASESYRVYFSDKIRGTIMRLSKDGLTPISDHGMKDWFKDNLRLSTKIFGSYDDKKDEYNVTLQGYESKTVSFKEDVKGWVSFKSFTPENAISMANDYYTFDKGDLYKHHVETVDRNDFYSPFTDPNSMPNSSSVTVVLNDNPSVVKEFNTLNYEGSQSKVEKFQSATLTNFDGSTSDYNDQEYYNLSTKAGWDVKSIITNKEEGHIDEFLEKEGKWFNYIKREIDLSLSKADTGDFSFQGIGFAGDITNIEQPELIRGCTDSGATNYNINATIDDGSCTYPPVYGCTDSLAENYDPKAEEDDGTCTYVVYGCTNSLATNYDPLATNDDGSCQYAPVYGCTDTKATNYDPLATIDDGSCTYDVYGCTYPSATNYNPLATIDDGSCEYTQTLYGCMDPLALNYYPGATVDDGTCIYTFNASAADCNTLSTQFEGCDDWHDWNDGNYAHPFDHLIFHWLYQLTQAGYTQNLDGTPLTLASVTNLLTNCCGPLSNTEGVNFGCTNPNATNYDSTALVDDGSCTFYG